MLVGNDGGWSANVWRTVAARFPLLTLKVNFHRAARATAGSVTWILPRHLTRAGFFPDQKRGLADSVHLFAPDDDQVRVTRPPRYVSRAGLSNNRAFTRERVAFGRAVRDAEASCRTADTLARTVAGSRPIIAWALTFGRPAALPAFMPATVPASA
jgi:hypothetical protein